MELVDLYDENRIPLGKTAERYGHKEPGEYRTVVHVCIFAPDGRMLVQQRTSCKVIWPGRWDVSAAGGVDAGEDSRMAAERECREELAVTVEPREVFMEVPHPYPDLTVHLTLFNASIREGTPQKLEHNDIRWIKVDEIDGYDFCPADEVILRKLKAIK